MKRVDCLMLIAVATFAAGACSRAEAPGAGRAPSMAASGSSENVEQIVNSMEQAWALAVLKADTAAIDGILADDFVTTLPDGSTSTKAQHLDELKTGVYKAETLVIGPVTVRVFGETAIATYSQSEKATYKGQAITARTLWTDVFVKRSGRWQIVAEHGGLAPKP